MGDGAAAVHRILADGVPRDALLCLNDQLALGALRALHAYGARTPEDVAVIGFDHVEAGRFSVPSLSTVAPDKEAVARVAVGLLLHCIRRPARPGRARPDDVGSPQDRVLAHRLVLRESTEGAEGAEGAAGRDPVW